MPRPVAQPSATAPHLRRARRNDIAALAACAGGPEAGRIRAVRRLLKTLAADVYVIARGDALEGVVAVTYGRSLRHGGLVATIDTLALLQTDFAATGDVASLVDCAVERARRRGCVAIESTLASPEIRDALAAHGFASGPQQLLRPLRASDEDQTSTDDQEMGGTS